MRGVQIEAPGFTHVRCHRNACLSELYVPYPLNGFEKATEARWVRRPSRWLRMPVWYCEMHA